jgi:uncharacterized protein (DUF58 family)
MRRDLAAAIDWGRLTPLRLHARTVAEGVNAGAHRSRRRGAGIEFGGHRPYVPGDDLRWLDRHALMRHGRLVVREFETDTDRALCLVVDATASMSYRSPAASSSKFAYAALLAAALARIAVAGGDPVAMDWIGGHGCRPLGPIAGLGAFDRIIAALETAKTSGDLQQEPAVLDRCAARVADHAPRGSVIVVISDLIDLSEGSPQRIASLATRGRTVVVAQTLDPYEVEFPFPGPVRLLSSEGNRIVETDAPAVRQAYRQRLQAFASLWRHELARRRGHLVEATTTADPIVKVRAILSAASRGRW